MKTLGIKILVVEAVLAAALWVGVYQAAHACDVSAAQSAAEDAQDYARRAKSAAEDSYSASDETTKTDSADDATRYARQAENAASDVTSYLSDCEAQ